MSFVLTRMQSSVRRLSKQPTASLPAVVAIALAGAAMLLMLALVDGLLLKPLPYPAPERLQYLSWRLAPGENFPRAMTERQAAFFIEHGRSFAAIGAYADPGTEFTIDGRGADALAERVAGVRIDAGVLPALGIAPQAGRGFDAEDARSAAPRVLLSHRLWQQRFGTADAIGASLRIDGVAHEVVGVMPPAFRFHPPVDLLVPAAPGGIGADGSNTHVIARLADGIDVAAAQAVLDALSSAYGEAGGGRGPHGTAQAVLLPYAAVVIGDTAGLLLPLAAAVALLALLACLNSATLLLGMSLARRGDAALELALGASRRSLLLSRMSEAALVVVAGLGLAVLLALLALPLIKAAVPVSLPRLQDVAIDISTLPLAAGAAAVMLLLCAGLAALGARIGPLADAVRAQSSARGGGSVGVQPLLVAGQVALSCVLLVGCALTLASFSRLLGQDGGFRTDGLQTVQLALADARYRDEASATARSVALLEALEQKLAAHPGVRAVASSSSLPLEVGLNNWIEAPDGLQADGSSVEVRTVSANYLELLGVPLLAGRGFDGSERADSLPTVIVNATLARHFFAEPTVAVGRRLVMDGVSWRIAGISADLREASLRVPALATVYVPRAQMHPAVQSAVNRWFTTALLVDAPGHSAGELVRSELAGLDRGIAITAARPLADVVGASLALERFFGGVLSAFAVLSLLLTAIGLYGVLGQLQWLRRHEFAVRLAIGADSRHNARLLLAQALGWTALGLLLGLPLAVLGRAGLGSVLFAPGLLADLPWLGGALLALAIAATAAALGPMRRASGVQAAAALRHD
jgi:putative ABC transport system permease protein